MSKEPKLVMKWFVTVTASLLLVFSTIHRTINGKEADPTLCMVFVFIAGLPWGAKIIDYFKK